MKKTMKSLDLSRELFVVRFRHGIKLVRPEVIQPFLKNECQIAQLLEMPFAIYFMNAESVILNMNDHTAMNCGFISIQDSLGKTVHHVAKKECARLSVQNDRFVVLSKQMKWIDETYLRLKDEVVLPALTLKFPWYDADNKIVGILGCSLLTKNNHPLADSLFSLMTRGLLHYFPNKKPVFDKELFTVREKEVLRCLMQEKSAKSIASILNLSTRTVENYLANIKTKMSVSSKSELIKKLLEDNFLY